MSERPTSQHQPKLAALAALQAERLSARGRQRLQLHLHSCELCRDALAGMRRFERLAADVAAAEPPALDWTRIEREALRAGEAQAQRRRFASRATATLLVAAGVLVALVTWLRPASAPVAAPAHAPRPRAPELLRVDVTALVGVVHVRLPNGQRELLTLDSHPQPGWTIETDAGADAHLWLADTAQLLVNEDSALRLTRLERDAIELGVERGTAVSKVRPLGARHYEVTAAGYRATVRGTHFAVSAHDTSAAVRVDEGHVVVLSASGASVADLIAPQAWASEPALAGGDGADRAALPIARAPVASSASALFTVPMLPTVVAWQVDGAVFRASGELRMRVPPGELDLTAELGDGRLVRTRVAIDPLGTRFDPALLRLPSTTRPTNDRAAVPAGQLDTTAAAAVIRGAQPALQRCYEHSLRTTDLAGVLKLKLRLALDANGRVRSSELASEQPLPNGLLECVRDATRSLSFPAPGGRGVTFEAPLSFHTR